MKIKKVRIGIIGCGTIGSQIAKALDTKFTDSAKLTAVFDIDEKKAHALRASLKNKPEILAIGMLIKRSDLVIEAASAAVSAAIAKKAVMSKKNIIVMSTGGIAKKYASLSNLAKKNGCKIYLPSGAICGIDGVKAAMLGKIHTALLTTKKPPAGLAGAPYITKNKIDLKKIRSETVIFRGSAREAIAGFPANVNVACTLGMAGIGLKKTKVKIVTSPDYKTNTHEVVVEGRFGKLITKTQNVPAPGNPKTSYMAVLSAIAALKRILDPIQVGT